MLSFRHVHLTSLAVLLAGTAPPSYAQIPVDRQIRENQARLDSIRRERNELQTERERLRGRVRTLADELGNLERQRNATGRLVNEMDRQTAALSARLDTITLDLLIAEDALAEKRAVRERRIVEIYKRGPLWDFQVLLAAESFGDLLARYKYLYLVSRQDQTLVTEVEQLRNRIARERRDLAAVRAELERNRQARGEEFERFVRLERERQLSLQQARRTEARTAQRLTALEADEQRLNDLLNDLERRRREAIAAGRAPVIDATITSSSMGRLQWPADGPVLYRFGRAPGPGNTVIRYDGLGIRAPVGTPVRAVADGYVSIAASFGTYGLSVILDHGGGFYTLYLYLSQLNVAAGTRVQAGATVGLSGGQASDHGPHVEFQIRQTQGGASIPLDPMNWLAPRR